MTHIANLVIMIIIYVSNNTLDGRYIMVTIILVCIELCNDFQVYILHLVGLLKPSTKNCKFTMAMPMTEHQHDCYVMRWLEMEAKQNIRK